MRHRLLALVLLIAVRTPSLAQHAGTRPDLARAIRAYQDLDFDVAATLLRRALSGQLSDAERVQALTYLGATEHYRGRPDSAAAVFRRLIALAPRYQPDTLVFPPEITQAYDDLRSRTESAARVELTVKDALLHTPPPPLPLPAAAPPPPPPPPPSRDTREILSEESPRGIVASGGGMVASIRANSTAGGLPSASGTVLGMAASARYGRLEVGVRYLAGSLGSRDVVEGAAALRFAATPWLTLHAGPQIRRYETPLDAERWVTWQVGARTEAPIVGTIVRGHAMVWQGLGLSVNVPPGSGTARGGEVGVTIDPSPLGPFWFGLAYGIDQASVRGSTRREKIEMLTITAGLRRR